MQPKKRDGKREKVGVWRDKVVKSVIICGAAREHDGLLIRRKRFYKRFEFFRIDNIKDGIDNIKDESTDLVPCFEPLMSCFRTGDIFQLRSRIYFMGTFFRDDDPVPDSIPNAFTGQLVPCTPGLSYVNTDPTTGTSSSWVSCGLPIQFGFLNSTALRHNIYAFGSSFRHPPIVFDPNTSHWSEFHVNPPPEIRTLSICDKIVPDHAKERIFLCLTNLEPLTNLKPRPFVLYAWYPKGRSGSGRDSWFCIDSSMPANAWSKNPTFADQDLLFFAFYDKPELFRAYDVHDRKWLELEWHVLCPRFPFDAGEVMSLFYMGDHQLCLALFKSFGNFEIINEYGSRITLAVFEYTKRSKSGSDTIITMSYLYTKRFYARNMAEPHQFIPID